MAIALETPAFAPQGMIPRQYTCDGDNISPPLVWGDVPENTESLALICEDPDAPSGTFDHWVLYNIPPSTQGLPEHLPPSEKLDDGSLQGVSDFGKTGYGGPCPPGGVHRYIFKIFALDTTLDLNAQAKKNDLLEAMKGHVIDQGELMGKYSRQ